VSAIPPEVVQDAHRVVSHGRDGPKKRPAVTLTHTQVVVVAAAMILLEFIDLRPPNRTGHPKAHDEKDWSALFPKDPVRQARPRLRKMLLH
jgi:hypothetical protein